MSYISPKYLTFFVVGAALAACSANGSGSSAGAGGSGGAAGSGGLGGSGLDAGGSGGGLLGDAGPLEDASGPPEAVVYGHSPTTLYRLDPDTKQVTVVGAFQGCTNVIDIALDKDSNLFATTGAGVAGGLFAIDPATASCLFIASGSYPNSLSFVPAGTLDPNEEALVGYVGSTYVRIDTRTGAVRDVGAISGGLSSSGDIVSVKGGGTYLTVNGAGCGDCIVEVNPATGDLVKNFGSVNHGSVYGLAFWAGTAYGFADDGSLFSIAFDPGGTVTTQDIAIPGAPGGLEFWGAGSTTSAPVNPVH